MEGGPSLTHSGFQTYMHVLSAWQTMRMQCTTKRKCPTPPGCAEIWEYAHACSRQVERNEPSVEHAQGVTIRIAAWFRATEADQWSVRKGNHPDNSPYRVWAWGGGSLATPAENQSTV